LPNDNDTTYCPQNQTSCYFQYSTGHTNSSAYAKCAAVNGYLVSYGSGEEQLQIENFFRVGRGAGSVSDFILPHEHYA
jgi:hypothetical protein